MKKTLLNIKNNIFFKIFISIFNFLFRILKFLAFLILIVYVIFVLLQKISNGRSVFGYRVFSILTGSMQGVYDVNDLILVKDYDYKKLVKGDDISYYGVVGDYRGKIISHRIKAIIEQDGITYFITQGINNEYEDPLIIGDQILGKIICRIPILSEINHLLKNVFGFFIVIFLPLVILLFSDFYDLLSELGFFEDKKSTSMDSLPDDIENLEIL